MFNLTSSDISTTFEKITENMELNRGLSSKNNLKQVSFFNDHGIIFENLQEINSFSYESHQKSKTGNNIFQIELKIDKIKINYKRKA